MEIPSSKTAEWVFKELGLAEEEESHLDHGSITNTIVSWINRTLDIDFQVIVFPCLLHATSLDKKSPPESGGLAVKGYASKNLLTIVSNRP